jgi:tetratricopeptide (TPR) repeat protein
LEVARTCASFPDFGQEVDEVHRRLMTELSKLLHEYSASSEFKFRTALIYRGWALALPTGAYLSTSEQALRDAISCLDKVTTTAPSTPGLGPLRANIHSLLGDVLQRAGRMEDAEAAFRQAMKIYRERAEEIAIDSMPVATSEIVSDNLRLAYFLVAAEKEKEAGEFVHQAALHVKHIRDSNASADALYYLAVMQLRLGDMAGYRATCNALAEVPFGKLSGLKKSRPIWTRCLGPDAIDDPKLSVKLAEQLVSDPSVGELHFRLYVLGATHYRSRQFDQAAQRLAESIAAFPSYSAPVTDSKNYHRLFLAMTQWQLGQKGDARRLLTDTLPDITEELESPTSTWNRRATLEILRHEAEALIEPKEANEAVENENTGNNEPKQPSALNPEP